MQHIPFARATWAIASTCLVGLVAGCGSETTGSGGNMPTTQTARQALESALTAWQKGQPPGLIASTTPPVQAVDLAWQGGQKLGGFSIVSEDDSEDVKKFSVKLTMKQPPGQKEVRYVVLGREPVWVYRDEDYTRMINMDNNPTPGRKPPSGRGSF
jgi:hypothetical protein